MKVSISDWDETTPQEISVEIESHDVYSLYYTLSKIIHPALLKFKEENIGYPSGLTEESWNEILDNMIWSFSQISEEYDSLDNPPEYYEKLQSGFELFGKYFNNLWN